MLRLDVGNREDMATSPAVASVRTAELLIFFMPERDAPVTSIASCDIDESFVNELHERRVL